MPPRRPAPPGVWKGHDRVSFRFQTSSQMLKGAFRAAAAGGGIGSRDGKLVLAAPARWECRLL